MLHADLLGPPSLSVGAETLQPPSRRAVALVAYVLVAGRPVPRAELAALLWEDKLSSLRQALYVLRKLPQAQTWLVADEHVSVVGRADLHALRRHAAEGDGDAVRSLIRGPFLQGLQDVGTPAFAEWVEAVRLEVDGAARAALLQQARRQLDARELDGAWATLAPELAAGAPQGAVLRLAVEVQLARGRHEAALALWEQGVPDVASGGAWAALGERVRRHPAVQRDAEWHTLSDGARRLARVLSLEVRPLPRGVAGAVAELVGHEEAAAWEALAEAGWLDGEVLRGDVRERVLARLGGGAAPLHRALAEALARSGADPLCVAEHEAHAGHPRAAVQRLLASGRHADLERARALAEDPADVLSVLRAGVARLHDEMRHDEVDGWLEALQASATRAQDGSALLQASLQLAYQQSLRGDHTAASRTVDRVVPPPDEPHVAARLSALRGVLALRRGDVAAVEEELAGAVATPWPRRADSVSLLAAATQQHGQADRASALYREALAAARQAGAIPAAVRALNGLAVVLAQQGDAAGALATFAEAVEAAQAAGLTGMLPALQVNLARYELVVGRLGSARARIQGLMGSGDPALARQVWMARGTLEATCGRFEEASTWLARARQAWGEGRAALRMTFHLCRHDWLATGDAAALQSMRQTAEALAAGPGGAPSARLLVALAVPDPDEARRWIPTQIPHGYAAMAGAARQRASLLAGASEVVQGPRRVGELVDVYRLALVAAALGDDGDEVRASVREASTAMGEGLLSTQRAAWSSRVQGWLADPVGTRGP